MKIIGSIIALTLAQCMLSKATPAYAIPRLLTRQTPSGIDQCQTPCAPIMNFIGAGQESCTPQACCTSTFEQDYLACFTCIGKAQNNIDYTSYQTQLDQFTAACDASGISVPKLTFPGQDPNRALPSLTLGTLPASTATNSPGGSTTSIVQTTITTLPTITTSPTTTSPTTITTLPTTSARNSGKKNAGINAVSHLGLVVISCIMMQSFL